MFCHGDTPTMADCCLIPQLYNADRWVLIIPVTHILAGLCQAANNGIPGRPSRCRRPTRGVIHDGETVTTTSGFVGIGVPRLYCPGCIGPIQDTGTPRDLSLFSAAGQGR